MAKININVFVFTHRGRQQTCRVGRAEFSLKRQLHPATPCQHVPAATPETFRKTDDRHITDLMSTAVCTGDGVIILAAVAKNVSAFLLPISKEGGPFPQQNCPPRQQEQGKY